MTEKLVLVTGACGEMGQALIQGLARRDGYQIVTSDLSPLPESVRALSAEHVQGDLVYKVKNFYDYDFEMKVQKKAKPAGYKDAFIAVYKNGDRLSFNEAKQYFK